MNDKEWIKNLTKATYANGEWQHQKSRSTVETIIIQQKSILTRLYKNFVDAIHVYNDLCEIKRKLKIFTYAVPIPSIVVMQGKVKATIYIHNRNLFIRIVAVKNYQEKTISHHCLQPVADEFGSVLWQHSAKLLLNEDMIVKLVVEKCTQYYFEYSEE